MKFLCDQCKAKYQISDDKVAGKTVRMKCRKCGHLIEVRAAVTETSVAGALGSEPPPAPGGGTRPPPAKPSVLPKSPLATSLAQAKPPVPRPGAAGKEGLSNAFKSSMQAKDDEAALLELSSADEWYAAINGVPVGPIRIGELRRKAALGAVTDDSLVWQEGMEEWRPVKTIPELASLVREAAATGRVSLVTPEPARASIAPPAPSMRPGPQRPMGPATRPSEPPRQQAGATARSNVVPITSRLATAERLEEAPSPTSERFSIAPDPFAMGGGASAPGAATAAAAMTPPVAAAVAPSPSAQAPVIVQMPRQTNYVGIGMILAMVAFGGVAAWALFFKAPPPPAPTPTIVTQYLPAPTVAPTQAAADPNAPPADSAGAAAASSSKRAGGAVAAAPKPSASAADLKGLMGPSGLSGLQGLAPTGPAAPATQSGSSLSGPQMEAVVRQHKAGMTRTCWVNIGGGGASSASEMVHLTIDGTGHVSSAHAEGNNGQVGTCLEREMKGWVFPASGASTAVDLPFKFVNQ